MQKIKWILLYTALMGLFACTQPQKSEKIGYLKSNITLSELNNSANFKRYHYICKNFQKRETAYLTTYFPLWRESRIAENFGFYFQLDQDKTEAFDHIENKPLNRTATRFEVHYRSYLPIDGDYVELKAREKSSIYYKNNQPWLECQER